MTRSPYRYAASTNGFYHIGVHGDAIPADAVPVSTSRHAELLAAQGSRRIVPGIDGKPALTPIRKLTRADLLTRAITAIKREAGRRILAIASLERQANDNAAMMLAAIDGASTVEAEAGRARRAAIDTVRTASDAIEAAIASWSMAALAKFDVGADPRWPLETAA